MRKTRPVKLAQVDGGEVVVDPSEVAALRAVAGEQPSAELYLRGVGPLPPVRGTVAEVWALLFPGFIPFKEL